MILLVDPCGACRGGSSHARHLLPLAGEVQSPGGRHRERVLLRPPTETSKKNLLGDGKPESRVWVIGNTGIGALRITVR